MTPGWLGALARRPRRFGPHVGADDAERGTTLMELVVTIFVFGLVLSSMATLTIGLQNSDQASVARVNSTQHGLVAMRSMSRNISRAVVPSAVGGTGNAAVTAAGATTLSLFAHLDDPTGTVGPSLVDYAVADGVLTQTIRIPKAGTRDDYCDALDASPACAGRVTTGVLCRDVRNTETDPLFVARDASGSATTAPTRVRSVDIALIVGNPGTRIVEHLAMSNLARLPN